MIVLHSNFEFFFSELCVYVKCVDRFLANLVVKETLTPRNVQNLNTTSVSAWQTTH